MNHIIQVSHLTRNFGNGKGVFDVNLSVQEGEVFGFLGPNGAGKSTTIRHLMGFLRAQEGTCQIFGLDCFRDAPKIQKNLGYLAGEIAFPNDMKGESLLSFMEQMKGIRQTERVQDLMERFALDPRGKIGKMSKGMKQKVGIVCAFMGEPEVVILDEPTSGLDPLMQKRFVDLVLEEKQKGTTIFMSSHIFEEVEKTCSRTAIIRNGKIVAIEKMENLKEKREKKIVITFAKRTELQAFMTLHKYRLIRRKGNTLTMHAPKEYGTLFSDLSQFQILDLDVENQSLEELFMKYYGGELA